MSIYHGLPPSVLYRYFYDPALLHWMTFLKESEDWDKEKIFVYQIEELRSLLAHAMKHVAYYRSLFSDTGFIPHKIQSPDDLKILPALTKETVRDRTAEFVDERLPVNSHIMRFTSGSTGIPLTIHSTSAHEAIFAAFRLHLMDKIGYSLKAREVMFWSKVELGRKTDLPFARFGNKLAISIRHLSRQMIPQHLTMMRDFRPEYIIGFPSVVTVLASYMKHHNIPPLNTVKAIIYYAETLYEWQRKIIEDSFNVRIFPFYSMSERVVVGSGCEYSDDLHLHPLYGFTEYSDRGNGFSEIIATGFTNYTMPLIRYKTDDLVSVRSDHCQHCNRNHVIVSTIKGRTSDFLVGKDRVIIPRLMPWIKVLPNVLQLQFFQDMPGKAYLKLIKTDAYTKDNSVFITERLREMLGPMKDAIDIELVFVTDIPRHSSGKLNLVDQRLDMKSFLEG